MQFNAIATLVNSYRNIRQFISKRSSIHIEAFFNMALGAGGRPFLAITVWGPWFGRAGLPWRCSAGIAVGASICVGGPSRPPRPPFSFRERGNEKRNTDMLNSVFLQGGLRV